MKKLATKLTPAIKQWIEKEFDCNLYSNNSEYRVFHFPNYYNGSGFNLGYHLYNIVKIGYTLVSEQEFLKEFSTKQKQMKPTTLSLELATIMYNGTDKQLKAFALENYPELAPKKSWDDELESEEYTISGSHINCFKLSDSLTREQNKHTLSKQQAERLAKKFTLEVEMTRFAELRNSGWVADWNNGDQEKWGIWDYRNPIADYRYNYNSFCFGITVKSKEIAEEMLEIFGERIKKCN